MEEDKDATGNGCTRGQIKDGRGSGTTRSGRCVASMGHGWQVEQRHVGVLRACTRSAPDVMTWRRVMCACCGVTTTVRGSTVTRQRRLWHDGADRGHVLAAAGQVRPHAQ